MFKLLSIVLTTASMGAVSAAPAKACDCGSSSASSSCCATAAAPSCCTTTAPAAGGNLQAMPGMPGMSQAQPAPNSARTYSYEPSMRSYSAPAARSQTPLYLVPKGQR
jgi:hypothetical protein